MSRRSSDTLLGHPKGLAFIVFTEAWERFSFYGMQALLVLYMTGKLLHPGTIEGVAGFAGFRVVLEGVFGHLSTQALATQIFGLYGGLIYLSPVLGGLIGDRLLGRGKAVILGAIVMAVGHFLMAFEAAFLLALTTLIVGCGLLKGNLAAQVGDLYAKDDARRDRAFSIYYLGINVGAFVAPLVCGTLGELYGWHYGFNAAGVGMVVGLFVYLVGRRHLPADVIARGDDPDARLTRDDVPVLAGLAVVLLTATLFWTAQSQVWNTYPLWVRDHLDRHFLFGLVIPVTWFQSIDTFAVLAIAPLSLWLWRRQAARGTEPGDLQKMATGCAVFALACVWLGLAEATSGGRPVAAAWAVAFHFTCAVGYLHVAPIGLALFSRAGPPAVNGMMIGVYYLSLFAGSVASGWLGRFYETLTRSQFWLMHAAVVGAGAVILLLFKRPLTRAMRLAPR
jgi:POT family proton-dependent oligopeptide transporter